MKMKKMLLAVSVATSLFARSLQEKQNFCSLINLQQTALVASVGGKTNSTFVVSVGNYDNPDVFYIKMRYSNGWNDIKSNAMLMGFKAIRIKTYSGKSKFYYFNK